MAIQNINVGAAPNDHTGDLLRDAFIKCNANFAELESLISAGVTQAELDAAIAAVQVELDNIYAILDTKSDVGHTHVISDVIGLQSALNAIIASFNSQISDINNNIVTLDNNVIHTTGDETKAGDITFVDDVILPNLDFDESGNFLTVGRRTGTNELISVPNGTQWKGEWVQQEYFPNQQVIDEGYLAIANTTTEERPAPQRVGDAFNIYEGTIGTTTTTARQVLFGNKYTFTENVFFEGWRIYLVAGNSYVVYLVKDPDGENIISQILQFVAQNSGWVDLKAQNLIIEAGSTYAALAAVSEPAVIPVTFNGNWNYSQPQNPGIPVSGGVTQPKSVPSLLYVSTLDSSAVDRSGDLATLNVGDTIQTSSNLWAIQSISPQAGYYIFGISPALLNVNLGVQTFTFETKSTATLTYALDPNYWLSNPSSVATVQGLLGIDIPYSSIVPDDTAYGIGVLIQNLVMSSDWDIQAYSGIGTGAGDSGGGGTSSININGNVGDEFRVAQGDSGVLLFGGLLPNTPTTINIGMVKGYVVDNETNPLVPSYIFIDYPGETNKTVTTIGSGLGTYVMIAPNGSGGGVISFQNTFPTSAERKTKIWIGKIAHPVGAITALIDEPDYITSPQAFSRDLFQVLGPYINNGVLAYPNGANLQVNITAGFIHGNGINFVTDKTDANRLPTGPFTPMTFLPRTQTGLGGGPVSAIIPGSYDVGGVITPVGGGANSSTLQYIFAIPGEGFVVQFGQTVHANLPAAIAAIGRETFVIFPNLVNNAILIGVLAVNKNATALNNETQAQFFPADKFGQIIGATSGIATGTLQQAYLNSLSPHITVNDTLGELTVQNGRALDTSIIQAWRNLTNTITASMTGNGDLTINYLSSKIPPTIVAGTTYTILESDNGRQVQTTNALPVTITIPTGLSGGFNCEVIQQGLGQITFLASGTVLRCSSFEVLTTQERWALVGIDNIPGIANEYHLIGQLTSI